MSIHKNLLNINPALFKDKDQPETSLAENEEKEAANIANAIVNLQSYETLFEDNHEAQKMLNLIHEIIERGTPTKASIKREKDDLDRRIKTSAYSIFSAMYLAKAGVPGAEQLLKDANDKYEQMKYVRSLIQTNPEEYIANKVTQVMKNMDTFTQGAAYLVGTMKRDKAQAFTAAAQGVQVQAQKELEALTRSYQLYEKEKEGLYTQMTNMDKKLATSPQGKTLIAELRNKIEQTDREMEDIRIKFKDLMGIYKVK
ncbi:MAG TPA: hypothetical protein PKZ69_01300 [Candidatus Cloacimonadota bacterium]|nr:hypothetical protein [Candidatus Cloacimonadota bacterium]